MGAKAYVATVGSGAQLHLVDRSGEEIAYVELRDFETEYNLVPGTTDTADATKIGQSLGQLIGVGVAATVQGRKFEPPSITKNTMYRTVPNGPKASTLKKSQA